MISTVNTAAAVLDVARADLAARIADAKGDTPPRSMAAWKRGGRARRQAGLQRAARLAAADARTPGRGAAASGRAADAEKVFRDDLERNRLNPRSLFGLWKRSSGRARPLRRPEASTRRSGRRGTVPDTTDSPI